VSRRLLDTELVHKFLEFLEFLDDEIFNLSTNFLDFLGDTLAQKLNITVDSLKCCLDSVPTLLDDLSIVA